MSITDELRKYVADNRAIYMTPFAAKCLIGIADSIDTEHEKAMSRAGQFEPPEDADNVLWSVGDRDEDGNVVTHLILDSAGWHVFTDRGLPYRPERKHHYHAPTVEDVLLEFANEVYADADNEIRDRDFLCAKYAKRLTLAGDAE